VSVLAALLQPALCAGMFGPVLVHDGDRAWELNVYADNKLLLKKTIEAPVGTRGRHWQNLHVDLSSFARQNVQLRLYQRVSLAGRMAGNAYWKAVNAVTLNHKQSCIQ
jgi:hypothetical protein